MLKTIVTRGAYRFDETILELEDAVLQSPDQILIKIINFGGMPPFVALAYHAILKNKSSKTKLITSAYTPIGGAETLIWLMGDMRMMAPHGWIFLPNVKSGNGGIADEYATVLTLINEYVEVSDILNKPLSILELNQLGLLTGSPLDIILNQSGNN